MSSDSDKRLVYWFVSAFDATHPSTSQLQALSQGYSAQKGSDSLALDFVRGGFLDITKGTLLSHDPKDPTEKNDILSYLDPVMNQAVAQKATVYLWGSKYSDSDGSSGIHDIHMNQGNAGSFADENATYQDGGIVLQFPDGTWQGVFLAFATQTPETDDSGNPEGETFAQTLGGSSSSSTTSSSSSSSKNTNTSSTSTSTARTSHATKGTVGIEAAVVNPKGPDGDAPPGKQETVYVQNKSAEGQKLGGWTIENGKGGAYRLPGDVVLSAHSKRGFEVRDACPLSNQGGEIVLKDEQGVTVSEVKYSKKEAHAEGRLLYFAQ